MKKILVVILALTLAISMVACNNKSVDISNASASDIAAAVKGSVTFRDEMLEVSNSVVADYYVLSDEATEMKVYMSSSGATAEEFAIFKCKDADTADAVEKACQKRIESLKEKFEEYIPAEMEKIENAVVQKRDCFVMSICADDTSAAVNSFENYK